MLENLAIFAETGLNEWVLWGLILSSYLTSALTAAFGIGGGIALLAIMSMAVPVATLIPVHGVVQLGSNAGRAWHLRQHIGWSFLLAFGIGSIFGAAVGSQFVVALPDETLKVILSLFVLFIVWAPKPKAMNTGPLLSLIVGSIATFASMFVGATGPLVAATISSKAGNRQEVVSTHAAAMTLQHGIKIAAFGFVGFLFSNWLALIILMIIAGYLGTITGGRILKKMDEALFRTIFKWLLTALALFMLIRAAT